jgi:CIC family chloride channel protein
MRLSIERLRQRLGTLTPSADLDLRILGRVLLQATLVGVAAGLMSALFSWVVERIQHLLLFELAGYLPLRAAGEGGHASGERPFRPLWILLLPALGATAAGWLAHRFGPETLGGGGNAAIRAFHRSEALTRKRVPLLKMVVSWLTLGTGGAGGREGPTMQIGSATGSLVARWLRATQRERRILYVAGIAAGVAAVFRTPLGAALFATEVLYRDDFESDALVPAILASVVGYSVAMPFGESVQLFAHAPSYPFHPAHLPYYLLLALCEAGLAVLFVRGLGVVRSQTGRLPGPVWLRPGVGGLGLGLLCAPLLWWLGTRLGRPGMGFGILGGGYGAAQVAITGAGWLPAGWGGVEVLLILCGLKLVASCFTVGSGGSAGDFAPSLVLGGLLGGAFGRAVALLSGDPRVDPGAFALVGMGTLFGGIAHVPLSSMVLVCELAGSYDLIVPLMLAEGVAFVALRKHSIYEAQAARRTRPLALSDSTPLALVRTVMRGTEGAITFRPTTAAREMLSLASSTSWQILFPVLAADGALVGVVPAQALQVLGSEMDVVDWVVASDLMQVPAVLPAEAPLTEGLARVLRSGLRQLPVVEDGRIVGYLDELQAGEWILEKTAFRPEPEGG